MHARYHVVDIFLEADYIVHLPSQGDPGHPEELSEEQSEDETGEGWEEVQRGWEIDAGDESQGTQAEEEGHEAVDAFGFDSLNSSVQNRDRLPEILLDLSTVTKFVHGWKIKHNNFVIHRFSPSFLWVTE